MTGLPGKLKEPKLSGAILSVHEGQLIRSRSTMQSRLSSHYSTDTTGTNTIGGKLIGSYGRLANFQHFLAKYSKDFGPVCICFRVVGLDWER